MASAQPAEPYRGWNAGVAAPPRSRRELDDYSGRHRGAGRRAWSLRRLFYVARHRRLP